MAKMRRHQSADDQKAEPDQTAGCADEAGNDRTGVNDYSRSFNIDDSQAPLDIPYKKQKESKRSKVDDSVAFEN